MSPRRGVGPSFMLKPSNPFSEALECVTLRSRSRQPDKIPAELPLFSFPSAAGERQVGKFWFPFGVNMPLLKGYSLCAPGKGGWLL